MYVSENVKSKAALKRLVASGEIVRVFSPGPWPCPQNGTVDVEGPHAPANHTWYGNVVVKDGVVQSVS